MKPQPKKKRYKTSDYLHWLDQHGYFARQVYMDGLTFILAVKAGRCFAVRINEPRGRKVKDETLDLFERSGGTALCVGSLDDLVTYNKTGVL